MTTQQPLRPLSPGRLLPGDPIGNLDRDIRETLKSSQESYAANPSLIARSNRQNLKPEIIDALTAAQARAYRQLRRNTRYVEFTDDELIRALWAATNEVNRASSDWPSAELVNFVRDDTDGTTYQRLNRESLVNGSALDLPYRRALAIVLIEQGSNIAMPQE